MGFTIRFSEEKNQLLKATRSIGFEEVIDALGSDGLLADIDHPSQKRINQRMYVVRVGSYVYAAPYVINTQKQEIFLKTIYPSRIFTKLYLGKGEQL
jgi:hypothetical protein